MFDPDLFDKVSIIKQYFFRFNKSPLVHHEKKVFVTLKFCCLLVIWIEFNRFQQKKRKNLGLLSAAQAITAKSFNLLINNWL